MFHASSKLVPKPLKKNLIIPSLYPFYTIRPHSKESSQNPPQTKNITLAKTNTFCQSYIFIKPHWHPTNTGKLPKSFQNPLKIQPRYVHRINEGNITVLLPYRTSTSTIKSTSTKIGSPPINKGNLPQTTSTSTSTSTSASTNTIQHNAQRWNQGICFNLLT